MARRDRTHMAVLAVVRCLFLGPLLGVAGSASADDTGQVRLGPELKECASESLPLAYCTSDQAAHWVLDGIWQEANARLDRSRGSQLFLSRDPGSEGFGIPIEAIRYENLSRLVETPPFPPPRWVFISESISTRDIGAAADQNWDPDSISAKLESSGFSRFQDAVEAGRADEFLPDVRAIAAGLPITTQMADVASCPGLQSKLDELEPLLRNVGGVDVPGIAGDADVVPVHTYDGWQQVLEVSGLVADGTSVKVRYEVDDAHPLGEWQSEMFDILKPCWRPLESPIH